MNQLEIKTVIRSALKEDLDMAGDITGLALFVDEKGKAEITFNSGGVLAGCEIARLVFLEIDDDLLISQNHRDGEPVRPGEVVMVIAGRIGSVLAAERTALNFLQHLSGISTNVRKYLQMVSDLPVIVADTRKTSPGLRMVEKYAVKVGGGANHRYGLFDMAMLKDNHIDCFGSIAKAVRKLRSTLGHAAKIEVETRNLAEVSEALNAGADVIMLDNMSIKEIGDAVELVAARAIVEASGGITTDNLRQIAETGVDVISIGELTKRPAAVDFSLKMTPL